MSVHTCLYIRVLLFSQEFFGSVEQFELSRDELLTQLDASVEALLGLPSENHQLLQDTVHQLKEALQFLTEKVCKYVHLVALHVRLFVSVSSGVTASLCMPSKPHYTLVLHVGH